MRDYRTRWSMLLVLVIAAITMVGITPTDVEAAGRVVIPDAWGESAAAAPEAQRRASRWQTALGLRLAQVASAPQDDRFAETVAVFERSEPIPADTLEDPSKAIAALSEVVAAVVGTEPPIEAELRTIDSGKTLVWGRWLVDDLSFECALAPSGDTATVVITAVLAKDANTEAPTLANVFARIDGVTDPMPRFSLMGWRLGSVLVWLALALGLHAAMLPLGDRDHDHGQAGKRAALINLVLVLIGAAVTVVALRGRELALAHVGTSVPAMTVWVAVAGMVVVGLHYLISNRLDVGPIQSAPSSGIHASGSGVYSSADVLRSSISRADLQIQNDPSDGLGPGYSSTQGRIVIDEAERE